MRILKAFFLWPYAALLLAALAFYRKVLFQPKEFAIPWDLRYYHLPLAEFMAKSFRQGHLPLWDPFTYCGWPVYAELTTQLFYPPTTIAVLLSNLAGVEASQLPCALAAGCTWNNTTGRPPRRI